MIASFKSRAVKRFWTKGDASGLKPEWVANIRIVLSRLDVASEPGMMTGVGFGFHSISGNKAGRYAVTVSHNWRITFAWRDEDAIDVDLEDYHGR